MPLPRPPSLDDAALAGPLTPAGDAPWDACEQMASVGSGPVTIGIDDVATGRRFAVACTARNTIADLKLLVALVLPQVPPREQRLIRAAQSSSTPAASSRDSHTTASAATATVTPSASSDALDTLFAATASSAVSTGLSSANSSCGTSASALAAATVKPTAAATVQRTGLVLEDHDSLRDLGLQSGDRLRLERAGGLAAAATTPSSSSPARALARSPQTSAGLHAPGTPLATTPTPSRAASSRTTPQASPLSTGLAPPARPSNTFRPFAPRPSPGRW